MKRQIVIIILLILNTLFVFIPTTIVRGDPSGGNVEGDGIWWENEYARLEVYPHTSTEIIRQRQWANLTWKANDNTIDVAFRFENSLSYGKIWKWNGTEYVNVTMQHTTYNNKHYYYYSGFNVVKDTTYRFKWEYDQPINTEGKWDLLAKLSSDTIQDALSSGRYVMLDPWWNSNWGSRMTITIPSDYVGDTITNFPLLLNFSGNTDITDNIQANGWDIRFIAQDNTTEYYYHFADIWSTYYKVWVKIPTINENTDTVFNMYFENAAATRSAYYSNDDVWDTKYLAVYYMNSTLDMSGNGYDLTNNGVAHTSTTSSIGTASDFDGSSYLYSTDDTLVSEMMEATGSGVMMGIDFTGGEVGNRMTLTINNTDNTLYVQDFWQSMEEQERMEVWSYQASFRWDEFLDDLDTSKIDMYARMSSASWITFWDSVSHTNWEVNTSYSGHPQTSTGRLVLGADATFGQKFIGYIDTVVLLNTNLTQHEMYLWTFNYKGSGLISYGPRVNLVVWVNATTDVTDTKATLNGYVNSSNQNEINCGFIYGRTSPVSNSNLDANVTAPDLYNVTYSFEYNISSLVPGEIYYVKSWGNDSDDRFVYSNESSFFTHPSNASSLEISGIELGVRLEWVHGTGYDVSILVNATGSNPSDPSNGTELYNGTGMNYEHIGLINNTQYYYSLWEWSSEGGYSEHSLGSQTASILFHSFQVDINVTTNVTEFNVTLNGWFTGDSLSGDYTCGFWYGTLYPVTETSKIGNVTAGIESSDTEFMYNLSSLSDGVLYYVKSWISNASAWETSSHRNFTTNTSEPTSLVLVVNDNMSIGLSWSKTYSSPATTVIVRKIDSYPSDWSDGTIIYNSTGTSYIDTPDLLAGSHWYYRVWGHINPFSVNYSEAAIQVVPFPPANITTNILSNSTFDINWDNGTGARATVVRRKLDSYPTGVTDGDLVYNGTSEKINIQDMEVSYYYSLWSYANETYSSSVNITVGGIVLYCFDEDTNETLEFDIFISNEDGSQTYEARNITNGYILNVSELPLGDAVKFVVSASQDYNDKTEISYWGVDENSTITYIVLSYPPVDKFSTNVTCINESTDVHSYPPFTLDGDLITILPDDSDNFTKVFINYTYSNYMSRTYYRSISTSSFYLLNAYLPPSNLASLYLLEVVDQYDSALEDVYIEIKNKVNASYVVVSSLYTDANGQVDLFLIEFDNYIFVINKTGYVTENASWTPGDLIFTHTFKLRFESDAVEPPELSETITLHGVISDDNILTVTFYDKDNAMLNSHFYVLEYYNKTFTYMGEYNGTTSNSITFTVDITNHTRMHVVRLYMNHSNLGETVNFSIYVMPVVEERDEGNWLERLIQNSGAGEWEYGYVITIIWYMPCIILIAGLGSMHQPGLGILGAGMWSGWITYYLIMPNETTIGIFSGIAFIVAFIVIALKQGKKVVHE